MSTSAGTSAGISASTSAGTGAGTGAVPAAASRPGRLAVLGQNQYGKAEVRVVKITRDGDTHHIKDLNVSVALSGDLDDVHYSGSNANVLTTDTTKNTVFAFAKKHGIESAEQFGIHLARHFVDDTAPITRARIRIEEYAWDRIVPSEVGSRFVGAEDVRHSFVRNGQETRTAQVTYDGESLEVLSGLKDLTVLNSTNSEFWGYLKDEYTTLKEDYDRILATEVSAVWRHGWSGRDGEAAPEWQCSYDWTREIMLRAFAETYSLSLQQTLYQMGAQVIEGRPELEEIRFSMPNKHHFKADLEPFGIKNETADGAVYIAADRPYGLIEATVLRDGAEALIPLDMTNL
jgi:urate oxidase